MEKRFIVTKSQLNRLVEKAKLADLVSDYIKVSSTEDYTKDFDIYSIIKNAIQKIDKGIKLTPKEKDGAIQKLKVLITGNDLDIKRFQDQIESYKKVIEIINNKG